MRSRNIRSTGNVEHCDGAGTYTRAAAAAPNWTNCATERRTTRTGLGRASINVINDLGGSRHWVADRRREHCDVAGKLAISKAPEPKIREVCGGTCKSLIFPARSSRSASEAIIASTSRLTAAKASAP